MSQDRFDRLPDWPRWLGPPRAAGVLRRANEDFRVDEIPAITPDGDGAHLWLRVRKDGANTDWVAGQIARLAGCAARDVGFAGMKDRHAIATQWFSVPAPADTESDPRSWSIEGVVILDAIRHGRKLRRGILKGNRFAIVIREVEGDLEDLQARLQSIRERGVPNYFGEQRFGHDGQNVRRGADWLARGGRLPRNKRSLYVSAVRSFLFNQVLADRVRLGNWDRLADGDVAMLDGTRSVFVCELPDPALESRCAGFDLHPAGPLPGRGGMLPARTAAEIENSALAPWSDLVEALGAAGVDADRRSFRLRPLGLEWSVRDNSIELAFELPPGSFATTVLDEIVAQS